MTAADFKAIRRRLDEGWFADMLRDGDNEEEAAIRALLAEVDRLQGLLDRQQEARTVAIKALERIEWRGNSFDAFSPVCAWCGGYERHPAMDQDYNGQPGHKPDCLREVALKALRGAIPPSPQNS
jgi:hypothetical protein